MGGVTIVGTTISSNLALREGGGIYNDEDGQLTVTGSTISGNVAIARAVESLAINTAY